MQKLPSRPRPRPRPDGPESSLTSFPALVMSAANYVLFKVVINCLLPITSRVLATIRPSHIFMLYALHQHLDVDIVANIFSSIIHHIQPVNNKVHMPFSNIITEWLESLGIDVTRGKIERMTKKYSRLGPRAFAKSKIVVHYGGVRWSDDRAVGELPGQVAAPADIPEDPEDLAAGGDKDDADDPDHEEVPDIRAQI